jgi:hypothetical protein
MTISECVRSSPWWGWSNLWGTIAADRWASFARKKFSFFKTKTHFGGRELQDDLSAQG